MTCRLCGSSAQPFLDLGASPPANSLKHSPHEEQLAYPLVLEWCDDCGNVQLRDTLSPEALYRDYLYVTPVSTALTEHYDRLRSFLVDESYVTERSSVVEIGSNVGHFLRHIRPSVRTVLGVDPARQIALRANEAGIPTLPEFFTGVLAEHLRASQGPCDLVVARHCLAHNPSPHEMVDAAAKILSQDGFFVIENAYVADTLANVEFDQVYHEHMFYYSIRSMRRLLAQHGLHLVDAMLAPVHGGSIVFVAGRGERTEPSSRMRDIETREAKILNVSGLESFARRTAEIRDDLRDLISRLLGDRQVIYTYGATAKGNTLLNFVGLTTSQIKYCADSSPTKIGMFLPGSNVEVISEESALGNPPDYFLLTAWNYEQEIVDKVRREGNRTSRFIVPIPEVRIAVE